jgi:uncharacterized cupin superfamily protein
MGGAGGERHPVRAGDCFLHPPGEAHQLINTGAEDLEVFIIADNPPLDAFHYPDSDKWGLRTPSVFFRMTPVDYFEGEDTVVEPPPPVPELPRPTTPFAARCRNVEDIAWEDWSSPKGRFRGSFRGVSLAFGAVHRAPLNAGGHPFDLELGKVPPHSALFAHHWHALQWEFYAFLDGRGEFRLGDERFAVGPGDCVMAAPGVAHSFANTGDTDLHYLVVADDPPNEFWVFPDSGKVGLAHPRRIIRPTDVDYYDGEE